MKNKNPECWTTTFGVYDLNGSLPASVVGADRILLEYQLSLDREVVGDEIPVVIAFRDSLELRAG